MKIKTWLGIALFTLVYIAVLEFIPKMSSADHLVQEQAYKQQIAPHPICYLVSSYSIGYEWQDEMINALKQNLGSTCTIIEYELDSKNNFRDIDNRSRHAFELYSTLKPNVVITSDDNAYNYFAEQYRKSIDVPIFAMGINWVAPERDDTFVVEMPPLVPMMEELKAAYNVQSIKFIAGNTSTTLRNIEHYRKAFTRLGVEFHFCATDTMDSWEDSIKKSQNYDVLLLQNNAGIKGWDTFRAKQFIKNNIKTITVSVNTWMLPYSMKVFSKLPSEQAYLLSTRVKSYLETGIIPKDIAYNTEYETFVNDGLKRQMILNIEKSLGVANGE